MWPSSYSCKSLCLLQRVTRPHQLILCFLIVALVSSAQVAFALNKAEIYATDEELKEIKDKEQLRVLGFRNATPHGVITRAVRNVEGGSKAFADLVEHFEDAVSKPNCFLRNVDWVDHIKHFALYRGFKPPNQACVSSTRERNSKLKVSPPEMLKRLQDLAGVAATSMEKAVEKDFPKLFSRARLPSGYRFEKNYQHCTVERVTALRIGANNTGLYYILMGVTDDHQTLDHPDWERKFINEFVGIGRDGRFRDPLPLHIFPYNTQDNVTKREYLSSALERWSGRVGLSAIYAMVLEASPALTHALEMGDVEVGQAIDALTPSNTAILALPMVMSLIPISLITHLSSLGLLIYTIVTDVLTTVPFIIKGFELIAMGNRRQVAEDTWFSGKTTDPMVVIETWVAECRIIRVRRVGIIFVAVGFSFLVLGVVAEFISHRLRERWIMDGTVEMGGTDNAKLALFRSHNGRGQTEEFDPDDEESAFRQQQIRRGAS